jgi:hypothetical protein
MANVFIIKFKIHDKGEELDFGRPKGRPLTRLADIKFKKEKRKASFS